MDKYTVRCNQFLAGFVVSALSVLVALAVRMVCDVYGAISVFLEALLYWVVIWNVGSALVWLFL